MNKLRRSRRWLWEGILHLVIPIWFVAFCLFWIIIFCSGCSGSGFDKRATVMPNSIGISFGQEKYKGDSDAWRGASISATWEFK